MEKCTIFRENRMGNRFKREKKQQKMRKLQKVAKKWPDTPLQKNRVSEWKFDRPVWDSVLDLIFCTPFQYFLQKVVFLRETSSLCYMKKSRCLTWKHYFLQKVLEGCAKIEVKLMSRVLGRLWGHQGRLWETPWGPQTNLGVRKGQLGSSSWSQDDPWSVQVGCKSVQVGSKSPTVRPTEPTARPIIYTNSRSTAPAAPY